MKHIKHINELLKSTYKSASDKLKKQHPTRAEKLIKHADEKGSSEFSRFDLDRDFPHPFEFNNSDLLDVKEHLLGKFYIVSAKEKTDMRSGYWGVDVRMLNDWGQSVSIIFTWGPEEWFKLKITFGPYSDGKSGPFSDGKLSYERGFLFNNRKDALAFKKYLSEKYEEDELLFNIDPSSFSTNKFYSSN